ncbi:MAG: hypothetical protein ABSF38_18545, partial [Verrucomicrobiota bacterium]
MVHAEDVVARVPWLLKFYRHCGTEVFYPAEGKIGLYLTRWTVEADASARRPCYGNCQASFRLYFIVPFGLRGQWFISERFLFKA